MQLMCDWNGRWPALQHLSRDLGVEVTYRTYAADCRLWIEDVGVNWTILASTIFDEFVVAHTLGERAAPDLLICFQKLLVQTGVSLCPGPFPAARVARDPGGAGTRQFHRACRNTLRVP